MQELTTYLFVKFSSASLSIKLILFKLYFTPIYDGWPTVSLFI